ncbi:MAG: nitroreductase family protein [Caulobacterales bacterium]
MGLTLNGRTADHDVDPQFLGRWSPRAFTGEPIPQDVLMSMFEAARWAPSAFNGQPWRFVYARREKPQDWDPLFGALIHYNQLWVTGASVLAFIASDRFRRHPERAPTPHPNHSFDAGAAWGYLALQAQKLGWAAHGMAGFDHAAAYAATGLPESDFQVEAAIAIGRPTDAGVLPEQFRAREVPSGRTPVESFVFEGRFAGG